MSLAILENKIKAEKSGEDLEAKVFDRMLQWEKRQFAERRDNIGWKEQKKFAYVRGRDDSRYGDINREHKRKGDNRCEGEGGWAKIDEKKKDN
jgi:hypothetical protein